jgi:hypothetical protein
MARGDNGEEGKMAGGSFFGVKMARGKWPRGNRRGETVLLGSQLPWSWEWAKSFYKSFCMQ